MVQSGSSFTLVTMAANSIRNLLYFSAIFFALHFQPFCIAEAIPAIGVDSEVHGKRFGGQ